MAFPSTRRRLEAPEYPMRCSVGSPVADEHGVVADHLFEDVPHLGVLALEHFFALLIVSAWPSSLSRRMMNG